MTSSTKTRFLIRRGLRADQPLATDVFEGTLYFVTDELLIERSNGIVWQGYSPGISGPIDVDADTIGTLPLTRTTGSLDIVTRTTGDLPIDTRSTGNLPFTRITGTVPLSQGGTNKTSWTVGSIPFAGTSGLLEDNVGLFFDATSKNLGLGTITPANLAFGSAKTLHLKDTTNGVAIRMEGTVANLELNSGANSFLWVTTNTDLIFATNNLERMRLYKDGNLGIGIAVPLAKIHIYGTSGTNDAGFRLENPTAGASNWQFTSATDGQFRITEIGVAARLIINKTTGQTWFSGNNFWFGTGSPVFGTSLVNGIVISNGTAPSTSPALCGQMWVEAGALKYRGSSGTVTTLGPA